VGGCGDGVISREDEKGVLDGEERPEHALAQLPAVLWSTDSNLSLTSVAGGLLDEFRVAPEEIVRNSVGDFFRRFGAELPALSAHRRALGGKSMRFEFESQTKIYEAHIVPRVDGGVTVGTVGLAVDVSETRHLQEQLRAAQRMESIGRLAGGIAHDFNNVLGVIESCSALLASELHDTSTLEDVEIIRAATRKATELVSQLLAFSRRQVRKPEVLDLNAVVADLGKMLQRVIGEDIKLSTSPGTGLGAIMADRGQVDQVIMNLVVNARDAMPNGGQIAIESRNARMDDAYLSRHAAGAPGPYVVLAVTDTGVGMDRATQARIFEPFFTTKAAGRGTGLGLATVYGIVKQSGGFIWVYSEQGRGSSFKVYFPRVDDMPVRREAHAAISNIGGDETILLVEDDDDLRRVTRRILQNRGYTILEARHGGDALLLCERYTGEIDMLLTDIVMPQMNGRDLSHRIRGLRPDMSVVYMSGYPDGAAVEQGLIDVDARFLAKPFTPHELLDCIRMVLDGK
jgi:two-component system, cell cycle sensor histidine kinase and response regulator CckA